MSDHRAWLSKLWIFVMFNFLYADVVLLIDVVYNGKVQSAIQFTPTALLGVSILLEVPMAMIILSRRLSYRENRWANIIVGAAYTLVTLVTQFILPISNGTTTTYYLFFGVIEILATSYIVWYALKWTAADMDIKGAAQ